MWKFLSVLACGFYFLVLTANGNELSHAANTGNVAKTLSSIFFTGLWLFVVSDLFYKLCVYLWLKK